MRSLLTADVLTEWLRRCGSLPTGAVTGISLDRQVETSTSTLRFLSATYTADVQGSPPRRLVLKSPLDLDAKPGDIGSEADFYRHVAAPLLCPPLVRCLATVDAGDGTPSSIVLEDLRASHDHPPWPLPPSRRECELAIDALASVHAHWWEAPALGNSIGQFHTAERLTNMVNGVAAQLPLFLDAFGEMLAPHARRVMERVFASSLRPWLRLTDTRALTIGHGDAHSWNFLFPRHGDGPAYLIDWELWHLDVGARDLAFFMALHWYPSRRSEVEAPLLEHYHRRLVAHGIRTYSLDELWLDYRLCVVRNLTIPIIFWSRGMKPERWWHRLHCALAAYHDLQCDELC